MEQKSSTSNSEAETADDEFKCLLQRVNEQLAHAGEIERLRKANFLAPQQWQEQNAGNKQEAAKESLAIPPYPTHVHDFQSDSFNERRKRIQEAERPDIKERVHLEYREHPEEEGSVDGPPETQNEQAKHGESTSHEDFKEKELLQHDLQEDGESMESSEVLRSLQVKYGGLKEEDLEPPDLSAHTHGVKAGLSKKKSSSFSVKSRDDRHEDTLSGKSSKWSELHLEERSEPDKLSSTWSLLRKGTREKIPDGDGLAAERGEEEQDKGGSRSDPFTTCDIAVRTPSGRDTKYMFKSKEFEGARERRSALFPVPKEEIERTCASPEFKRSGHRHDFAGAGGGLDDGREADVGAEFEELYRFEYRQGIARSKAKAKADVFRSSPAPMSSDPTNSLYNPGLQQTRFQPMDSCNRCTTNKNIQFPTHPIHSGGQVSPTKMTSPEITEHESPPEVPEGEVSEEQSPPEITNRESRARMDEQQQFPVQTDEQQQFPVQTDEQQPQPQTDEEEQQDLKQPPPQEDEQQSPPYAAEQQSPEQGTKQKTISEQMKVSPVLPPPKHSSLESAQLSKEDNDDLNKLKSIMKRVYIRMEEIALLTEVRSRLERDGRAEQVKPTAATRLRQVHDMAQELDQRLCHDMTSRSGRRKVKTSSKSQ